MPSSHISEVYEKDTSLRRSGNLSESEVIHTEVWRDYNFHFGN